MSLKNIVSIILFAFISLGYSQNSKNNSNYLITYLEKRTLSKETLKRIDGFPEVLKEKLMNQSLIGTLKELYITNEGSVFKSKETLKDIQNGDRKMSFVQTKYFKKNNDSLLIVEKGNIEFNANIKEKWISYNWELTNAIKTIENKECKKAIGTDFYGNKLIAWYDESFPVFNGPSEYRGLPGLILEIDAGKYSYSVVKIEKMATNRKINFPSIKNAMSRIDYDKKFNRKDSKVSSETRTELRPKF